MCVSWIWCLISTRCVAGTVQGGTGMDGRVMLIWDKVYAILDEVFLAGEIEETSKQVVLTRLEHLDKLE